MKKAYEGTRNICDRMATKIINACNDYWISGDKHKMFGIINPDSAEKMENLAYAMQEVAVTGCISDGQWDAVKLATKLNNEWSVCK